MDGEAVFAANTDLNSLTLPQTLSQGLFPGPGAASDGALDKWSRGNPCGCVRNWSAAGEGQRGKSIALRSAAGRWWRAHLHQVRAGKTVMNPR